VVREWPRSDNAPAGLGVRVAKRERADLYAHGNPVDPSFCAARYGCITGTRATDAVSWWAVARSRQVAHAAMLARKRTVAASTMRSAAEGTASNRAKNSRGVAA
jgi:hypothetical protein